MIQSNGKQSNHNSSSSSLADCGVRQFFGKYRGLVTMNVDPKGEGRVLVEVPEVSPIPLVNWASVAMPSGGAQNGIYAVPPIGAKVWVEFECGDIDYPIVSGTIVDGSFEVPKKAPPVIPGVQSITVQTPTQNGLVVSDLPGPAGGVQITTRLNQKILVTDLGIELDNGMGASIKMIGPTIQIDAAQVNINKGALTII